MNVDVYLRRRSKHPIKFGLPDNFAKGIEKLGDRVIDYDHPNQAANRLSPVGVIFGGAKSKDIHSPRGKAIHYHRTGQQKLICLDGGLFRGFTDEKVPEETCYFRIGLGLPTADGEFFNENSPGDRWEQFQKDFAHVGIRMYPWRDPDPHQHILICTQPFKGGGWSMDDQDSIAMSKTWITEIRKHTKRPIVIRPHPSIDFWLGNNQHHSMVVTDSDRKHRAVEFAQLFDYSEFENVSISADFSKGSTLKDFENAWCVVTYNSTTCTEALLYGLPVFITSPGKTFVDGYCERDLSNIESPTLHDRTQWINNMCYTMYSFEEMRQGIPWEKFKRNLGYYT